MTTGRIRRINTGKAQATHAAHKAKNRLGQLIISAKQPAIRLGNTIGKSTTLIQQFTARKAAPIPRVGKKLGNVPARYSHYLPGFKIPKLSDMRFPKLPKIKAPRLPDPIGFIRGLDLKSKIPKLGWPKIKLPDPIGFLKEKFGDVVDSVTGLVEKTTGAAEDWQAARKRKWMIAKIVVVAIIVFLGMLIWKKK